MGEKIMMETVVDFLAMGGYWPYVWPAYGITFLLLVINALIPIYQQQRILKRTQGHADSS